MCQMEIANETLFLSLCQDLKTVEKVNRKIFNSIQGSTVNDRINSWTFPSECYDEQFFLAREEGSLYVTRLETMIDKYKTKIN